MKIVVDTKAISGLGLIGVAYSHVERNLFPTKAAFEAEVEVVERANQVIESIKKLGLKVKGYEADEYFLATVMFDKPDLVINLVDTYKGIDRLSTSIPATLELLDIEFTGAGIQGFVLGNNRQLTKQILDNYKIPTPPFQFIQRSGVEIKKELGLPLIVKLNESGGSVGIDNKAVKETFGAVKRRVKKMLTDYKMPVLVEKFIDGTEVSAIVFDDGNKKHVFLGEKDFNGNKNDGRHQFTSLESYKDPNSYKYIKHTTHSKKIKRYVLQAFNVLKHADYGKFDIRIDEKTTIPYIIDSNPNTAFGPSLGLPITDVASKYGVTFEDMLLGLLSKHAKNILGKRNS